MSKDYEYGDFPDEARRKQKMMAAKDFEAAVRNFQATGKLSAALLLSPDSRSDEQRESDERCRVELAEWDAVLELQRKQSAV